MTFLILALSLLAPRPGACRPSADDENHIVAVVNDEVVTQSELNRALMPAYLQMQATLGPEEISRQMTVLKEKILEQIIDERIMLQIARDPQPVEVAKGKIGTPPVIEVSEEDVEEVLEETRSRFNGPEEFQEALSQQGVMEEDLKARFREQLILQRLISREVRSRISVSPAEVTDFYQKHLEEFKTPPAVQVATLFIRPEDNLDFSRAESLARDLHKQLGQGADFYDLASRHSDGFNAKMGGRIGLLEKGKNLKEIDAVLFTLKEGQVSPVIRTSAGFHIFKIESVHPSREAQLAEVQAKIQDRLFQEKASERYKDWIAKLRAESYVQLK